MKHHTIYCKHCGKLIDADSKFCQYCGGKLEYKLSNINNDNQDSLVAMLKNGIMTTDKYAAKILKKLLKWIRKYWWRILLFIAIAVIIVFLLLDGLYENDYRSLNFLAIIILFPIMLYVCCWRSVKLALSLMALLIISYGIFIKFEVFKGYQISYLDKVKREFCCFFQKLHISRRCYIDWI